MDEHERNSLSLPGEVSPLLAVLRELIGQARQKVYRAAHNAQVQTYWQVGRHIVEYEQQGAGRAAYGSQLLARLAQSLTSEFGRGFDARNLRNMRAFYTSFPNWNALRSELSLMRICKLSTWKDRRARSS